MIDLALHGAELFYDQSKKVYMRVPSGDHYETIQCQSEDFKRYLSKKLYDAQGKGPGREALSTAIRTIEAIAIFKKA